MFFFLYIFMVGVLMICAVVIALSVYFKYLNAEGRKLSKIPSVDGMPIFDNVFSFMMDCEQLFNTLRKYYKKYKGIYVLRGFNYRLVNISEPQDVEKILSASRFNNKRLPYIFLQQWLGGGILVSNGDKWHERRKLLTPAFHFKILKKFFVSINEQTEQLLDIIQKEVGREKTDVFPLVAKSNLQITCETSMGTSMGEDIKSVTDRYLENIDTLGKCMLYRYGRIWLYPEAIFKWTKYGRIQKTAATNLHEFTRQIIRERRKYGGENNIASVDNDDDDVYGKKNRMAMLDLLLEQEKQGYIDEDGIRAEVDNFMFAGHDTTATALLFMIMRIANETTVQDLIYEEMLRIFGQSSRSPTIEDLSEMKYLECCIKESLRVYPTVPFISRVTYEEVELSGYTVPKDTELNIHIFDIHRREDIYPEPEKFIPERFLPENSTKRHPYAYIPFSAGPRNCMGQKFAMLTLKSVMSGIIRRFRLEPVTRPEDIRFTCDLVLRAAHPVYVRFLNRNRLEE